MADLGGLFFSPLTADQNYQQQQKLFPVELAQKAASTRYTTSLAEHLETENAADKSVSAMMAQRAAGGGGGGAAATQPQTISQRLLSLSDLYAQAGMPTRAAQYAQQASEAASHESTASAADVRKQFDQFKMTAGMVDRAVNLFGGVHDATSWDEMNSVVEKETGKPSPFANTPYDPKMVDMLKDQAMSEFQRQELAVRRAANDARIADIRSAMAHRGVQEANADREYARKVQNDTWKQKQGGKDVGAPTKTETEAAARLIGADLDGDEKDTAAFTLAANARILRNRNKGLSADDALRQALLQAKQAGDFVPFVKNTWGRNTPGKFITPQPLPSKAADLVVGQHYGKGDGSVYEFVGEKKGDKGTPWKKIGEGRAPAPVSTGGGGGGDSGDDDDDE